MESIPLGKQIKNLRNKNNLSQLGLAIKCNLNIRTIQRIENNEVEPRSYTLKILSEALGKNLIREDTNDDLEIASLRNEFEKRKRFRIILFVGALLVLFSALILILLNIPKSYWAPIIYILMFADIIAIALTWRCPGCNKILGDVFNTKYCSHCGLKFYNK